MATLPAPTPRSPPKYPDLCGKHRKQAELQVLNREIGFLEEELQSLDGLQPASRCCKEVDDFVVMNTDPFIPLNRKTCRTYRLWKWLRLKSCFKLSWLCCFSGCAFHLKWKCCTCDPARYYRCCCNHHHCCHCHSCPCCFSCPEKSCWTSCCVLPSLSCPDCSCSCTWSCPKCTTVCCCPKCTRNCCIPCCLCF